MPKSTVSYVWRVERLDTALASPDFVTQVHWRLTATNGVSSTDAYGVTCLGEPSPDRFVAFEDLTPDLVIAWLKAAIDARAAAIGEDLGDEYGREPTVVQLRTGLAGCLAVTSTLTPLPWG